MMQDVLFNTLFCKANQDMAEIAERIDEDPRPFKKRAAQTADAINKKLWYDKEQMYADFDLQAGKKVQSRVLSGFIPLFAGIPEDGRARKVFDYLNTHCFCQMTDTCHAAPTFDRSGEGYSASYYWRGPVWINMNWLLAMGLEQYGHTEYAANLRQSIIELPQECGFREYFDTDSGEGYGSKNFSWTAALLLDVLYRQERFEF